MESKINRIFDAMLTKMGYDGYAQLFVSIVPDGENVWVDGVQYSENRFFVWCSTRPDGSEIFCVDDTCPSFVGYIDALYNSLDNGNYFIREQ